MATKTTPNTVRKPNKPNLDNTQDRKIIQATEAIWQHQWQTIKNIIKRQKEHNEQQEIATKKLSTYILTHQRNIHKQ